MMDDGIQRPQVSRASSLRARHRTGIVIPCLGATEPTILVFKASLVACAVQQQDRLHQRCLHFTESQAAARIAARLHELRQVY
jgi:hypothetical protein